MDDDLETRLCYLMDISIGNVVDVVSGDKENKHKDNDDDEDEGIELIDDGHHSVGTMRNDRKGQRIDDEKHDGQVDDIDKWIQWDHNTIDHSISNEIEISSIGDDISESSGGSPSSPSKIIGDRRSASTETSSSTSGCLSDIDIQSVEPSSPPSSTSDLTLSPSSSTMSNDFSSKNEFDTSMKNQFKNGFNLKKDYKKTKTPTNNNSPSSDVKDNIVNNPVDNNSSFFCKWTNCDWPGNYDDLVDHIREIHVELQPYQQQRHNWSESKKKFEHKSSQKMKKEQNKTKDESKKEQIKVIEQQSKKTELKINDKMKKEQKDSNVDEDIYSSTGKKRIKTNQELSQQYVCLWEGCKVYGKPSLSRNWLERHVLQHSGPRPFKCIVQNCGARFKMQSALERHVNSHFKPNLELSSINSNSNQESSDTLITLINNNMINNNHNHNEQMFATTFCGVNLNAATALSASTSSLLLSSNSLSSMSLLSNSLSLNNHQISVNHLPPSLSSSLTFSHATMMRAKSSDSKDNSNGTPNKILKRKKSTTKIKRRCIIVKGNEDFFDECTMEHLRFGLAQLNAHTELDISNGSHGNQITFHSKVIGRRESENGEVNLLLKWEPPFILPDTWISECELSQHFEKVVSISSLPSDKLMQILDPDTNPGLFCQPKRKKQKRK